MKPLPAPRFQQPRDLMPALAPRKRLLPADNIRLKGQETIQRLR